MTSKLLLFGIILLLFLPLFSLPVHALYVFPLPTNTLFADDFNEYASGTDLRAGTDASNLNGCPAAPGSHICVGKSGWSWFDNAPNGYAHISNNNSFSAPVSMEMASPTTFSGAKFDIHHLVPTTNTTRIVSLSTYFAFDNFTRNGVGGNNELTFSLETWDFNFRYECVIAIFPAAAIVQVVSDDTLPSGGNYLIRLAAYDDTRMSASTGNWHHIFLACDLFNHRYVSVIIDNMDILAAIPTVTPKTNSIADTEMLIGSTQFSRPVRVEMAMLNNPTSSFHIWHKWADDIVVTDITSTTTCGPLCLSAINLSAWFGVLMVTVGAGTSSSLYFGAARMLRGEPFKSKEVVALLAAGALGVLAFGVMMAVAVGLIKIIPGG